MIPTWLAIILVNLLCGVPLGLLISSNAEVKANEYSGNSHSFMFFGRGSVLQLLASGLLNAILGLLLFLGPSLLLINLFNLAPLYGYDRTVWGFSLFGSVGIGKFIRWWRWSKTHDYY